MQFLSEPSGGSDLAGLVTQATRDGDVFVMSGSKIWSSGAFRSDYAMCLARTDPHVPKHQGLTMFIVKIHQPGIEVQRIAMVNGQAEFCQEFFDDVAIPAENVIGQVNDGWTVASRLLFHERDAVGGGRPTCSGVAVGDAEKGGQRSDLADLARATGQADDPRGPPAGGRGPGQRPGAAAAHRSDGRRDPDRGPAGAGRGASPDSSPPPTASAPSISGWRSPASGAGAWVSDDPAGRRGQLYLTRQSNSLGGGSNEMQRNIISERVLGMPREYAADRDRPFDEVRHNRVTPEDRLSDSAPSGHPDGSCDLESHELVQVAAHDLDDVVVGQARRVRRRSSWGRTCPRGGDSRIRTAPGRRRASPPGPSGPPRGRGGRRCCA